MRGPQGVAWQGLDGLDWRIYAPLQTLTNAPFVLAIQGWEWWTVPFASCIVTSPITSTRVQLEFSAGGVVCGRYMTTGLTGVGAGPQIIAGIGLSQFSIASQWESITVADHVYQGDGSLSWLLQLPDAATTCASCKMMVVGRLAGGPARQK